MRKKWLSSGLRTGRRAPALPAFFLLRFGPVSGHNAPTMFSLQKLLGKEDKFFTLLEASAEEARTSRTDPGQIDQGPREPSAATRVRFFTAQGQADHPGDQYRRLYHVYHGVGARGHRGAVRTRSTKSPRPSRSSASGFSWRRSTCKGLIFLSRSPCSSGLRMSCSSLVKSLRNGMNLEKVKRPQTTKLQFLEGEADKQMMLLYKDLFQRKARARAGSSCSKTCMSCSRKSLDRCRDAGNVIAHNRLEEFLSRPWRCCCWSWWWRLAFEFINGFHDTANSVARGGGLAGADTHAGYHAGRLPPT